MQAMSFGERRGCLKVTSRVHALYLPFTAFWTGPVVAVPVPVAAAARAAKVDLVSIAGSAAGRFAELFGVEVAEQLAGTVVAAHGNHHFAASLLGQGVETAQHDGVVVDDDDLLVGDIHLYHVGDDGAQGGEGFFEALLLLEGVARIADEYRDLYAAADCRSGRRVWTRDATQADHSQIEFWAWEIKCANCW